LKVNPLYEYLVSNTRFCHFSGNTFLVSDNFLRRCIEEVQVRESSEGKTIWEYARRLRK